MRFEPSEPFVPARGLSTGHAQTIAGAVLRRGRRVAGVRRECWTTPDGDEVLVELLEAPRDRPQVVVLHGLEGSTRSGYVVRLLELLADRRMGAVALNFRSCGGHAGRGLRTYNSGDTGDLRWLVQRLRARGGRGPLGAVGFSLGANVLLRLLEEDGSTSPVDAGVAISTPFDLGACARTLDGPGLVQPLYRLYFLTPLKQKARAKAKAFPGAFDLDQVERARGIEAFDGALTAPVWGFRSASEYYERSSSGPRLGDIRRPTLLLSAADDPFIPAQTFPSPGIVAANPQLTAILTAHGGHVGFIGGAPWTPRFWAEEQAVEFLARAL